MHPSSLLSYYPTYAILDEVVATKNYKNVVIFIDLKNALQTTYMEHAIVNIIESSKKGNNLDSSIFSSLLSFLSFHKIYGLKRGINISFVVFFETGISYYHKNISKTYKVSRAIDDLYGLDKESRDLFYKVLQSNFGLIEKACNRLPNTKVIRLQNLEADFIPYYILTRNLVEKDEKTVFITYSNDHDLWQCAMNDSFIFSKSFKSKKIIKANSIMSIFFGKDCDFKDEYLPLAMSIVGDSGDDVKGIKGIAQKRLFDVFPSVINCVGNMDSLYENVTNNKEIFSLSSLEDKNKYLNMIEEEEKNNKIISNNLKLVSFELISRAVENPATTEMLERKNYISKVLNNKEEAPKISFKNALEMAGVFLEDGSIDILYL